MKNKLGQIHQGAQPDKARTGDSGWSFEAIFTKYWTRVCNLLTSLVGDRDEAEDLALEVFWRFYSKPPQSGVNQNLGGWLYRVATNLGYNALRARRRRQRYEESASMLELESASPHNPAQELDKAEERRHVRQALAHMNPRSAKILALRYSGLSYVEIATAIGVSRTSVGTLLARAEREFERQYKIIERGRA